MAYVDTLVERLKQEKYSGVESPEFFFDETRIRKGEPYEYVLGYTNFLGCHVDLSLRPMIPRPETAFWVERAVGELKKKREELGRPLRLAEVYAGSGAIGCALLVNLPDAHVDISELDPRLKEQIEMNVAKNNAVDRARVITAPNFEGLTGTYDAVFAVPPYIPYEALPELDQEMIDYEPHMAFLAHDDGHEFLEILIREGREFLNDGGTLYVEADIDDNDVVRKLAEGTLWSAVEFWPDPYGATPNVILRK
jgi:release factor glutamine methyltransferase